MARINFEDNVEAQDEFWRLLESLGDDRDRALGKLIRFFRLAQWAYGHDEPMTADDLRAKGFECMIESGWAVPVSGGYHALGAAKHFNWYRQKVRAGKMGGRPRNVESREVHAANRTVSSVNLEVPAVNPLALAPSLALAKKQETKTKGDAEAPQLPEISSKSLQTQDGKQKNQAREKAATFAAAYVNAYKTRYPTGRPEDLNDPKIRGQILSWIKDYPLERACELIQVYFQIDLKWFDTKGYDFITFRNNLNKIAQALDSGQDPGGINWANVFGRPA